VTNVSTTTTSGGSSNVTTPSITLQPFFSGIALDVTPQIDDDNNIVLHVHPSISVVTEKQKVIDLGELGTYTLPLANSTVSETDSVVRVQDGNIVAIGGLMKQEQSSDANGLPGTTSSGWGWLFGARNSYLKKRELVILIKPTIIRNESSWKDDLFETQNRVQQLDPRWRSRRARDRCR
jgi:MSHA biogenesis protein MshL